jgi:hypothetical protein
MFLFTYTALNKFLHHEQFKIVLLQSPLISAMASLLAWFIPTIEILLVSLLFFQRPRLLGLYGSFLLLALFTLYIIYMLAWVPNLPCSCGGFIQLLSWKQHLLFNSFLIVLSLIAISMERSVLKKQGDSMPTA